MQFIPLVSIITPVYNGAAYLDELIVSVRDQDYPAMEHIIIDDGSNDNGATVAILKKYPHMRWWSRENRGQYATMNEGLEAAQGNIICFISADDVMLPGAVRKAVAFMGSHKNHDGVWGITEFMDKDGDIIKAKFPLHTFPTSLYGYFTHISHCSLYIKRDKVMSNNLKFKSILHYVGDYDWILSVLEALRLGYMASPLSCVRLHDEQTSALYKEAMALELKRVFQDHHLSPTLDKLLKAGFRVINSLYFLSLAWQSGGFEKATAFVVRGVKRRFGTYHE
jgi:glycosyltransferase involved in cell wall biosynthesis